MEDTTADLARHERLRGSNQAGLRAHNERAVLSLIRASGVMAKADIARRTGLSPQTASVIMRALEGEELVLRDAPRRGKVGQPSVPMRLNPDGAFSIGLKIGRRSAEMVLMDFVGALRGRVRRTYLLPNVQEIAAFMESGTTTLLEPLSQAARRRVVGVGTAMPTEIWDWGEEIGAPLGAMDAWKSLDIADFVSRHCALPAQVANDGTAACAAEQVFGTSGSQDFVYFFVGAFVGGGIVVDGHLLSGRRGNAGALGSMPVPLPAGGTGQLINAASIHVLEKMMAADGREPSQLWNEEGVWPTDLGTLLERWIDEAASGLAHAVVAACSVYDFEYALIDGSIPETVRERLVDATRRHLAALHREGLSPVEVRAGTIGLQAREIGAASLPFFARFLLDHRVL